MTAAVLATASPASAADTWSANVKITFISDRDGGGDVFVMNDDGSHPRNITPNGSVLADGPAISPNGKRVAFTRFGLHDQEIWVVGTNGGHLKNLTKNDSEDYSPAWSPNGRKIAYACVGTHSSNLCVINVKSGHVKKLTHGDEFAIFSPSWSPDGKQIAVDSLDGIEVIAAKSGDPQGGTFTGGSPSWSPNGKSLDYYFYDGNSEIYRAKPDGSQPKNLTHNAAGDYFYD